MTRRKPLQHDLINAWWASIEAEDGCDEEIWGKMNPEDRMFIWQTIRIEGDERWGNTPEDCRQALEILEAEIRTRDARS